jgi:signal transduction histidine kinase
MLSSLINIQYCYDYLLNQIPTGLLLYSHVPTAIAALLFGIFLIYKTRNLASGTLFVVCASFAAWCFLDLASWFSFLGSSSTMFTWSLVDLFSLIFFVFSYYFLYAFITKKDLPGWHKVIGALMLLPTAIWTFLGSNLTSFNSNYCEAIENELVTLYPYYVQGIVLLAVIVLTIVQYRKYQDRRHKREILLAGTGVTLFLGFFFAATLAVNMLVNYEIVEYAYNFEIYGLFGMPVLLVLLVYLVVKYQSFNIRLIGAQALVVSLIALIASQFFYTQEITSQVLNAVTLVVSIAFGYLLVKGIKRDIKAKEEIERLAGTLKKSNDRLIELDTQKTEFVSFATHQLRAPLASMKGYVSLILEGDYGQITEEVRQSLNVIFESCKTLANVVDGYLNISRIELGTMKYDFAPLDVGKLVEEVVRELKPNIEKSGLQFDLVYDKAVPFMVSADQDKLKQVIANLIDNSVKYTPKGEMHVAVEKNVTKNTVLFSVKDTGIGMSKETIPKLFEKFIRASNANKANIHGTGLGLFVAKEIVGAHKGRVWAESQGDGKGSQFYVELPLIK